MTSPDESPVVVVGAGISGVACARALAAAGVPVELLDRGHRLGGRMAARTLGGRPVDLGASYFTVPDEAPRFAAVVEDWRERGLARAWTSTFHVSEPGAAPEAKDGPVRWAAPGALRSLVEDLAAPLAVRRAEVGAVDRPGGALSVDGTPARAVVLAMPDRQARTVLGPGLAATAARLDRDWEPVLALVATWPAGVLASSGWDYDGAFVNDDDVLSFVADDGRRRGDGAPVLVAHSTPDFARGHLEDPDAAGPALAAALVARFGLPDPEEVLVKRWGQARPTGERTAPYLLDESGLGVCGDGWGPASKVATAWSSGDALGRALAARLTES